MSLGIRTDGAILAFIIEHTVVHILNKFFLSLCCMRVTNALL